MRDKQDVKNDRKSKTGYRGLPKKGGRGGKGVWGDPLEQSGPAWIDKGDPNYVADERSRLSK